MLPISNGYLLSFYKYMFLPRMAFLTLTLHTFYLTKSTCWIQWEILISGRESTLSNFSDTCQMNAVIIHSIWHILKRNVHSVLVTEMGQS